jgi:hypothetical protein
VSLISVISSICGPWLSPLKSCGCKALIKYPKFNVTGGAGNACCDGGAVICGSCGGAVICGSSGINPCDVACANVSTGVEVVVSRH